MLISIARHVSGSVTQSGPSQLRKDATGLDTWGSKIVIKAQHIA